MIRRFLENIGLLESSNLAQKVDELAGGVAEIKGGFAEIKETLKSVVIAQTQQNGGTFALVIFSYFSSSPVV